MAQSKTADLKTRTKPVDDSQITFSSEVMRKTIHIGSLSIPIGYYYLSRDTALKILVPVTLFSLFIDVSRHYIPFIKRAINGVFAKILRPHERTSGLLSGATYVFISALTCVFLFPKMITITAFAILIVSDASSALLGRAYGKHKFLDKSLEGTLAFIGSAWLVVLLTPKAGTTWVEYAIGFVAAVVGGIAEAWSVTLHFDDNLSVPVSIGLVMWGLYYLASIVDPASYLDLYKAMQALS